MIRISVLLLATVSLGFSSNLHKRAAGVQKPPVWDALSQLRGNNKAMQTDQIQELMFNVRPGEDFPILSAIPSDIHVDCASFNQPGFYADDSDKGKCQVFHRCDINGNLTSYLCPNMTLFNQITLVCDWWYNVDCSQSKSFADYSNSRLYQGEEVHLLDDQKDASSPAKESSSSATADTPLPERKTKKKGKPKKDEQKSEIASADKKSEDLQITPATTAASSETTAAGKKDETADGGKKLKPAHNRRKPQYH